MEHLGDRSVDDHLRPGPGIGFSVGESERHVAGFRTSHRQALEARRIAVAGGLAGTVRYRDVAVVALATADAELADAFVRRELGSLVGDHESNRRLLATLAVVLDEMGSPTRAARRLGVHPNTVVKRLERAEVAMGHRLDTSSLAMRVAVEIAVLASSPSR